MIHSSDSFNQSGMDLIIDGWFHERGELWPGQAMSLQVKNVLYHGRSKFQDVLIFVSMTELNRPLSMNVCAITHEKSLLGIYQSWQCFGFRWSNTGY